jgi:hypothetical protein
MPNGNNRSGVYTRKQVGNAPVDGQLIASNGMWRLYERTKPEGEQAGQPGWRNFKLVCAHPVRGGKANYWVSYRAGDDDLRQSDSHRLKSQHPDLHAWVLGLVRCAPL